MIERRRAVALSQHYRYEQGLSVAQIADRLARSAATVKAYLYDPTGAKARAVKARYQGVCRGCGAYTQPRNGKGDAYAYCKRCHPGAIKRRWTRELVISAMLEWRERYGRLPSSYDWSRTHARRRGERALRRLAVGRWPAATVVSAVFGTWAAAREAAAETSPGGVSSLLSAAAERRSYTGVRQNPMLRGDVKKPRAKRVRPVLVFAPVTFEAVRLELLDAPGRGERERARDALWQSCTSLAGLRPEEAWALQPDFFRERTIAVLQAVAHGEVKRTKEDEWHYPPLHPVLREELDAYLERWPVEFGQLIFDDPALPGRPIADHNWRNWRKRVWRGARDRALAHVPARERAKLLAARPYDLGRHSYASLRLRAGMSNNLAGLVAELGHTTISQLSATYAHEIAKYRGAEPVDWVAEVRSARARLARRTLRSAA